MRKSERRFTIGVCALSIVGGLALGALMTWTGPSLLGVAGRMVDGAQLGPGEETRATVRGDDVSTRRRSIDLVTQTAEVSPVEASGSSVNELETSVDRSDPATKKPSTDVTEQPGGPTARDGERADGRQPPTAPGRDDRVSPPPAPSPRDDDEVAEGSTAVDDGERSGQESTDGATEPDPDSSGPGNGDEDPSGPGNGNPLDNSGPGNGNGSDCSGPGNGNALGNGNGSDSSGPGNGNGNGPPANRGPSIEGIPPEGSG
jgi:hypothetical protein